MSWYVEFIPNEVDSVSVNIDNAYWTTWKSSEGRVKKKLDPQWAENEQIHIYAAAHPRGKNASLLVYWDNSIRKVMDFDNDEDHDVSKSKAPRLYAADSYAEHVGQGGGTKKK